MKLLTIGDSLSQGLMSGAAARTDLSFSTLIARAMGLNPGPANKPGIDYYYPEWRKGGLPANLEYILRKMNTCYGSDIRGLDWVTILHHINRVIDESEDYYEREEGRADNRYHGKVPSFHNISSWSFEIADSWLVTPELCFNEIEKRKKTDGRDGWMAIPNAAFYRTALKVLAPNLDSNYTQLDWLRYHASTEGIENLILWLGSNNVLKTVLKLKITATDNDPDRRPHQFSHRERKLKGWNLWHPEDFLAEYSEFIQRTHEILIHYNISKNWRVFVGNIPHTTIIPILKGIGPKIEIKNKGSYYKYYTFMPFNENFALKKKIYIPFHRALFLNDCIDDYNATIKNLISEKNKQLKSDSYAPLPTDRYHLVDMCDAFDQMDWHRNNGKPTYNFPPYFDNINPKVNTKFYDVDENGKMKDGGLFGLDGVHPSAIGHGIIAHEFIKVMKRAGAHFKRPLNWDDIFRSDSLYQRPVSIMKIMYSHETIAEFMIKIAQDYIE